MKDKTKSDKFRQEMLDQAMGEKFTQALGSKVIVDRTELQSDRLSTLREVLKDMGQDLERTGAVPKGMTYMGSFSVHVFSSEILRQMAFATLHAPGSMPFEVADGACRELTNSVRETYNKARQKLRSGF